MRSLLVCILLCCSASALAQAKARTGDIIANYTYSKAKKPVEKSITLQEVKRAYTIVKQSTFNPPAPKDFFNEYLRFKMGVEVGLNEKSLVKTPNFENMIVNPFLKNAVQQELYKALAELKLKKEMGKLNKTSAALSDNTLKRLYASEPEFNIFFIAVNHPIGPSAKQIKEAEERAKKIHAQIIKSKKPFLELVALYSDDKSNGTLGINRSRASIPPAVYTKLKSMTRGAISPPIRVPFGYFIVKLNRKVPFSEANKEAIKANYFNEKRTKIFNNYFDGLKKDFRVNIVKPNLIKTL